MLSTTVEHALRALTCLARADGPILARDLAVEAEVPAGYLSKVLASLTKAGILNATRGTGGGYRMQRQPEEVRLIDVVEVFEGARARPGCLFGTTRDCSDDDPCSAHSTWRGVKLAYVEFLEHRTIADLMPTQVVQHRSTDGTGQPPAA